MGSRRCTATLAGKNIWWPSVAKAEPVNSGKENSGLETTPDLVFKQEAIETKSKVGRAIETLSFEA